MALTLRWSRIPSLATALSLALAASAPPVSADPLPATPQRPTFTTDASIVEAGALEIEGGFSGGSDSWSLPTQVKYRPDHEFGLLRGVELSVVFDAVVNAEDLTGGSSTEIGDRVTILARQPQSSREQWTYAFAPQMTLIYRGDRGGRIGATGIAVWADRSRTVAVNGTISAGFSGGPGNPDSKLDLAADYSMALDEQGRYGAFAGLLLEAQDGGNAISWGVGGTYRHTADLVLDAAVNRLEFVGGGRETRFLAGATKSLGILGG